MTLSWRTEVLTAASELITGDREDLYGAPVEDFARTAGVLNALGYRASGSRKLAPHDIALLVIAIKLSRLVWTPKHVDSWVDIAGYAGCGCECSLAEQEANDACSEEDSNTCESNGKASRDCQSCTCSA